MNYGKWHEVFTNKVKNYGEFDCHCALTDCHDTLQVRTNLGTDDPYYIKLWAEIDAIRERQLQLSKVTA